MNPHVRGQFMKIKPRTMREERTVLSRNGAKKTGLPALKNIPGLYHTEV